MPKRKPKNQNVILRLTVDELAEIDALAESAGKSRSEFIRLACLERGQMKLALERHGSEIAELRAMVEAGRAT